VPIRNDRFVIVLNASRTYPVSDAFLNQPCCHLRLSARCEATGWDKFHIAPNEGQIFRRQFLRCEKLTFPSGIQASSDPTPAFLPWQNQRIFPGVLPIEIHAARSCLLMLPAWKCSVCGSGGGVNASVPPRRRVTSMVRAFVRAACLVHAAVQFSPRRKFQVEWLSV
jgi:hypothetical protein